jgi:toxin ParE1/3/4
LRKLVLADAAKADLLKIADYTERTWGIDRKRVYLALLRDRLAILRDTPEIGTAREDLAPEIRSLLIGKHIAFYDHDTAAVTILRLLHQSMDVNRQIGDEP